MKNNNHPVPNWLGRLSSVWNRHKKVYTKNMLSNGFPPFIEPLVFLAGIGFGLGGFIKQMEGVPYLQFLSTGLMISTSMMTAAFECSFGTFIRLEFDKIYDGMLAAPVTVKNLLFGEILWAGTKGFFFSLAVLIIVAAFGIIRTPAALFVPLIGFVTGLMFASFSLLITSIVKSLDQFNFYFSGFLSPMFFFTGIVFPVSSLPFPLRVLAEVLPLTHPVRITRAICFNKWGWINLYDALYMVVFVLFFSALAVSLLRKKLID